MKRRSHIGKWIALLLVQLCLVQLNAQQLPQYTQYMLNDFPINPAIAGKGQDYWEGISNNRYQWVGITDAPRTYILSLQGPSRNRKMGFGGTLFTDIVGPTRRVGFQGAYSYHLKLNETFNLNLGMSAGVLQYSVDGHKLYLHDNDDPVIPIVYKSALVPDFGAGVYLHSDKFYLSISVPQFYDAQVRFEDMTHSTLSRIKPHTYGLVGYKFDLNEDFKLEPSVMVKFISPAPVKVDGGLRLNYQNKIWIGANYRTNDAITGLVGFMYNNWLMFGYSYDYTTTRLRNYSTGTHEIMLGMRFTRPKTPTYKDEQD